MEMESSRTAGGSAAHPEERDPIGPKTDGPVVAVMLASGIGALVLGIFTVLSEANEDIHEFLEFSERVGPLSGKTVLATAAFLVSWGGLHMALRDREVAWRTALAVTVVLLVIALVLTFPPFFQLFKDE
jgi:hypothetical protein